MGDPVLWKYKTLKGEDAVTDRWGDIPQAQRVHAQPFGVVAPPAHNEIAMPAIGHFDALSFGGGAIVGAAVALIFARSRRTVVKLALAVGVLLLGAGAYLGFLRREAGLSGGASTSPREIIADVHGAAAAMKDHFGEQQKALETVEASEK